MLLGKETDFVSHTLVISGKKWIEQTTQFLLWDVNRMGMDCCQNWTQFFSWGVNKMGMDCLRINPNCWSACMKPASHIKTCLVAGKNQQLNLRIHLAFEVASSTLWAMPSCSCSDIQMWSQAIATSVAPLSLAPWRGAAAPPNCSWFTELQPIPPSSKTEAGVGVQQIISALDPTNS